VLTGASVTVNERRISFTVIGPSGVTSAASIKFRKTKNQPLRVNARISWLGLLLRQDRTTFARFEDYRFCAGFRMPASDSRATYISGRRPKAAKERTRGGDGRRALGTPLWGFG
jgi:hypothetical protein